MKSDTFLWHDYETFGVDPRRDRPCQFAALRTDQNLEPIGKPVVLYCQPTSDVLPSPEACLVTGITPQRAMREGIAEYEFARRINEMMSEPGTCTVGFNNLRFDDEVSRFLFWRNFIDPYAREFRNGNSRFDIIDLARMCRALRPKGINWPQREDGHPSFRLEDLAAANGFPVDRAHDALADVENTRSMAALIQSRQPKLWDWALSMRDKKHTDQLLSAQKPLLHVSARYPSSDFCIAPALPLFRHPKIRTQWLVWNLRHDPLPFVELDSDLIAELYWNASADLPDGYQRLPVKWIRSNRCPMLAPVGVLDGAAAERTGISLDLAATHAETLTRAQDFHGRLQDALTSELQGSAADAETALYEGFIDSGDRRLANSIQGKPFEELAELAGQGIGPFSDPRLNELLLHFVGRHAPEQLGLEAHEKWQRYRHQRLIEDPDLATLRLDEYQAKIEHLQHQHPDRSSVLDALRAWPTELGLNSP